MPGGCVIIAKSRFLETDMSPIERMSAWVTENRKFARSVFPGGWAANWSHCSLYPASNQRAASKLSDKPKTLKNFPPRRSTVATPPGFHRPTNRRHATQQKEKPHSRNAPHKRLVLIWN
ncbi:hypothetical protein TNCV_2867741 [Trichonephila clavipes]|nr:hypothetical protein TNCV_2867741 [Trichonephila clavipes]